tara:strand:+ start:2152 stop:2418 length:267 start_codon:yes stop_codon:yes gene_type:complete
MAKPNLVEMKQLIAVMRDNGVLHLKQGDMEVTLHPSALKIDLEEVNIEASGRPVRYQNDYDNPMLYPDGVDPVAEQREWLKVQEAAKQ